MRIYCIDKSGKRIFKLLLNRLQLCSNFLEKNIVITVFPFFWADTIEGIENWNSYYNRCPSNSIIFKLEDLVCRPFKSFPEVNYDILQKHMIDYTSSKRACILYYYNYGNIEHNVLLHEHLNKNLMKLFDYPILKEKLLNNIHRKIFNDNICFEMYEKFSKYMEAGCDIEKIENIWSKEEIPARFHINIKQKGETNIELVNRIFNDFVILEHIWNLKLFYHIDIQHSSIVKEFLNEKVGDCLLIDKPSTFSIYVGQNLSEEFQKFKTNNFCQIKL